MTALPAWKGKEIASRRDRHE
jgi:hypothetical protein